MSNPAKILLAQHILAEPYLLSRFIFIQALYLPARRMDKKDNTYSPQTSGVPLCHSVTIMSALAAFVVLLVTASTIRAVFDPLQHSGGASPYFDAPTLPGLGPETPEGCVVDQAAYFVRHGSRYPEPGSFTGWQNLFFKIQNATFTAHGPLAFLPSWVPPVDNIAHEPLYLSSTGAREAFDFGVELRQRYGFTPGGGSFTVWSAGQQRVVDTGTYFLRGYLSSGNYLSDISLNRGHLIMLPDSLTPAEAANLTMTNGGGGAFADSLTPSSSCPAYAIYSGNGSTTSGVFKGTYQNQIAERLNGFLGRGGNLSFNATDVGVMQDLCGFGFEVSGDERFCEIFTGECVCLDPLPLPVPFSYPLRSLPASSSPPPPSSLHFKNVSNASHTEDEWLDYEYAADLNYYYGAGPGNPLSAATGYPWIKAVTSLFEAGPGNTVQGGTLTPPALIMGFSHDNNIPPLISALGLWNNTVLPFTHRDTNPGREFRSSHLVAFRGYVALERLNCGEGGDGAQLSSRALLNDTDLGVFHQAGVFGGNVLGSTSNASVSTSSTDDDMRTESAKRTTSQSQPKPQPQPQSKLYIRIRADNAPIPLPKCSSGPGQTCPLDEFVEMVNGPLARAAGDFGEVCGLGNLTGSGVSGLSEVKFLTTMGDGTEVLVGLDPVGLVQD
ncbi:hypothetical protein D9757_006032 [Collybiopsis confluens]|uniref:Phosphoglycerate mutase-like protein n=1 Tax=Collybiopsis confluens TaxID=2823264 RepID=A0A8H5HUE6_9AGAR|nr:hypothetical protein D9757_006032 [Collybiopsis confluens]